MVTILEVLIIMPGHVHLLTKHYHSAAIIITQIVMLTMIS